MKIRNKNIIMVLLAIVVFHCVCCADKLHLTKTTFTGNQLRMDGYYYDHYAYYEDRNYYDPIILYRNGVMLHGGVGDSLESLDSIFSEEKWSKYYKNNRSGWGIYQIEGNSIKIEQWYHSNAWFYQAYIRTGTILNDTTFVLTSVERSNQFQPKGKRERYRKYHFRKFSPKPDSTNRFVPTGTLTIVR